MGPGTDPANDPVHDVNVPLSDEDPALTLSPIKFFLK